MTDTTLAQSDHPHRGWRRAGRVVGLGAFASTPWLTLGFGTAIAFVVAAVLFSYRSTLHAVVLWISAATYTGVVLVEIVDATVSPDAADGWVFNACLLITIVIGGLQALAFVVIAVGRGYRLRDHRLTPADATADAAGAGAPDEGRRRRRSSPAGGIVLALLVALLTTAVSAVLISNALFQRDHRDALGAVTSVRMSTECSGSPVPSCTDHFHPTVRFTTGAGAVIEAETSDFRSDDAGPLKPGATIAVHYDPSNPHDVRLGTGWNGEDMVFIALMMVVYACCGFIVVRATRSRRAQARSRRG